MSPVTPEGSLMSSDKSETAPECHGEGGESGKIKAEDKERKSVRRRCHAAQEDVCQ